MAVIEQIANKEERRGYMNEINSILPCYYKHKIAVVGKGDIFIEYRDALVDCIRKYGFETNAYLEINDAIEDKPTCIVVINPMLYSVPKNFDIIWIMIQTEQLLIGEKQYEQPFLKKNINSIKPYLKRYDIVLDGCKLNISGLRKMTSSVVEYFPYGWYPQLENSIRGNTEKKYDLLFIGTMPGIDDRRKALLDFLSSRYSMFPKTTLWHDEKIEAINSSKICLNIHFDESRYMEKMRLFDFWTNKGFVLSEPMHSTEPFVEGQDYAEFFWTNISEKIDYYLAHEEEREKIASSAYKKAHENSLYDSTKVLLDALILTSYKKIQLKKAKKEHRAAKEFMKLISFTIQRIINRAKRIISGKSKS